ncbi:major facilitator superfamily domain-containing protein [Umbelopsis sp. PMI_123]|nr:major facilitator superfamily domain-containing protein [Umbelopsis sp. PMI_123]
MSIKSKHSDVEFTDKLIRKFDWKILPWLCVIGFLQFMDKVSLNYASVLGIIPDTHLQGSEYAILSQLPNGYMMQRLPRAKLVGTIVTICGAILAITALGKNFSELAGLRFLLGFFEVMGYGIGHMEGNMGLYAWQWLLIILGSVTSCFGILVVFFLIDDPRSPKLKLSEEDKVIMNERLKDTDIKQSNKINWSQVKECYGDPKTYALFLISMCINMTNDALQTFAGLAIVGLGFSVRSLLSIPSGVANVLVIVFVTFNSRLLLSVNANTSGYTKKIFTNAVVLIGYTVRNIIGPLITTSNQAPLYVGGVIGCIAANVVAMVVIIVIRIWMARMNKTMASNPSPKVEDDGDQTDLVDPNFVYKV